MPRGQKSKRRAKEKRRQAQEEPRDQDVAPDSILNDTVIAYLEFDEEPNKVDEDTIKYFQELALSDLFFKGPLDDKVVMLVHYLLYKYQMKEPITKVEIMKNVIQTQRNQFNEVLRRASEHLELIFGLDLKEVDPNKHIYVLINKLELSHNSGLNDNRGVPKTGLLMTILGVIFTKGTSATEREVWQILKVIGLNVRKEHFIFGNLRKLITKDMVQEQYLVYRPVPNSDPPIHEFLWGPRAYAETTKMKVLEFLAKVHDTLPSAFPVLYEEALKDEEERAQARAEAKALKTSKLMITSSSHSK